MRLATVEAMGMMHRVVAAGHTNVAESAENKVEQIRAKNEVH